MEVESIGNRIVLSLGTSHHPRHRRSVTHHDARHAYPYRPQCSAVGCGDWPAYRCSTGGRRGPTVTLRPSRMRPPECRGPRPLPGHCEGGAGQCSTHAAVVPRPGFLSDAPGPRHSKAYVSLDLARMPDMGMQKELSVCGGTLVIDWSVSNG
jgi:hypothetical protein